MGEKLFEAYLTSQGYQIFHPQRYSLSEQLTVYSEAEKLIFCDGAALHACILLPDLRAQVAVICRRRESRWDPAEIINQFRGYGKDVTWIDAVRYQYKFGLETWDARSFVDWLEVSVRLRERGFTAEAFDDARTVDFSAVAAAEVRNYIGSIYHDPSVVRYLMQLKE